jgi:hypothetical protein
VDRDATSVRIRSGNVSLFEVSTALFDGTPRIESRHEARQLVIEVRGGWLPGTDVPADLRLFAERLGLGWDTRFEIPALGFESEFALEPWLLGQPIYGMISLGSLLAELPNVTIGLQRIARTAFYPSWTFHLESRRKVELLTLAGAMHVDDIQVDFEGPAEASIGGERQHVARTRIWAVGECSSTQPVRVDGAEVRFADQKVELALQMHRDQHSARNTHVTLESNASVVAGVVHPYPLIDTVDLGMTAHRLRVAAVNMEPARADADLQHPSCWRTLNGINVEITAAGGSFTSTCQGGVGPFVVTRIVAPMEGVDQAMFLRRGLSWTNQGKTLDTSAIAVQASLDNLEWISEALKRGHDIPLDDFDLIVSRGADAFQMTTRFQGIALHPDGPRSRLLPQAGKTPLIEFALGSQHIYEQALYVTELPGSTPAKNPRYITDDQICRLNKLGTGQVCQTALCNARNNGTYENLRNYALNLLGSEVIPSPSVKAAKVRFAAPSWFTFEWQLGAQNESNIALAADDLFDWNRTLKDNKKRYLPRLHSNAKPEGLSLTDQIGLHGDKASQPISLADGAHRSNVEQVTIIQAPYRLGLSPISDLTWKVRSAAAADRPELTELWSIRAESLKLRAVWSPDFKPENFWANNYTHRDQPFRSSLDPHDRHELVALTSRFGETALLGSAGVVPKPNAPSEGVFVPQPVQARLVLLSSFGATLRLKGTWSPPAAATACGGALTVQLWDQNSQLGRDNRVVVEYKGFLCPLGHPATLVKETERRLVFDPSAGIVARLVQRFYIRVPEFVRRLPLKQQPFSGRGWPFSNISMRAWVTPDLAKPEEDDFLGLGQQAFWPHEARGDSLVDFEFEDTVSGVKKTAPLIFLDNSVVHSPDLLRQIVLAYRNGVEAARRGAGDWKRPESYVSALKSEQSGVAKYIGRIGSGKVRFAPEDKPGNSSYRVSSFLLDADIPRPGPTQGMPSNASCCGAGAQPTTVNPSGWTLPLEEEGAGDVRQALMMSVELETANQPPIYPHLRQALIEPGVLSQLSNTGRQRALVEIDTYYLRSGFDAGNTGEIYLRFVDDGASLDFSSDTGNSGGFANATMNMSAASRKRGPIGGAGAPLPQRPGYRYGSASALHIAAVLAATPQADEDPVKMARQGDSDPKEFFARSIGKAKLAGVVDFIAIVNVVMKASGAEAPKIIQQLEHAVPLDKIHKAAANLKALLQTLDTQVSRVPRIAAAVADVESLLGRASTASTGELIALGAPLVSAFEKLRDEVRIVIENPAMLLPAETLAWLNSLIQLSKMLKQPTTIAQTILRVLVDAAQADLLQKAQNALIDDPRFAQLQQRIGAVRDALQAIENVKIADPLALLAALQRQLIAWLNGALDLDIWRVWVEHAQADLNSQIDQYWQAVLVVLNDSERSVTAAAQRLKYEVDHLAGNIDAKLAVAPNQPELRRAFLEIADIGLSAVSHATELTQAIQDIGTLKPRDPKQLDQLDKAVQSFRCTLDALAKVPRLTNLVATAFPGSHDADQMVAEYTNWVTVAGRDLQGRVLQRVGQSITTALAAAAPDSKRALVWLKTKVEAANAVVTKISGMQVPSDLSAIYEVLDFLRTAPDPKRIALNALNQAKLAAGDAVVRQLAAACGRLADFVADVRQRVLDAQTGSTNLPDFQRWLSPSFRARLTQLATDLDAVGGHPDPNEQALRAYLESLSAVSSDLTSLIAEVGHVLATGDVSALIDLQNLAERALDEIGIPTGATISYDWSTQVHPYPGGSGAVFEPLGGTGTLRISSQAKINYLKPGSAQMSIVATLDPFKINLFGSLSFLTITFKPLSFTAGTGQKSKLVADVASVGFGDQLAFVKKLQEWLKNKFGITVVPWTDGPGLVVGYQFSEPLITVTAFSIQNVGFNIACILPFNSEAARFRFGLSSPEKPFLLSVGIYGGGGFIGIQSRADTIEFLESSFEYGLVTAFKFGPASGTGRITAGIYIRVGGRSALLTGFFNASGNADIAGLICVSATFRVQISYDTGTGCASGSATFSISFSIGFFDFTFSVGVAYARQGESGSSTDRDSTARSSTNGGARALLATDSSSRAERELLAFDSARFGSVAARKQEQAKKIPTDEITGDLSKLFLKSDNWARYWDAFEEPLDECA